MGSSMIGLLGGFFGVAGILLLITILNPMRCPQCKTKLSRTTRKYAIPKYQGGGRVCYKCGSKIDPKGNKLPF
jgi:hypothetical protein